MQLKNKNWFLLLGIVVVVVVFTWFQYILNKQSVSPMSNTLITTPSYSVANLKDFNKYEAEKNPKIPEYSLPLQTSDIVNLQDIKSIITISKSANNLLSKNGFVVAPNTVFKNMKLGSSEEMDMSTRFEDYYDYLHYKISDFAQYGSDQDAKPIMTKHLPIFISADSILHYFHLTFDTTLIKLETNVFYDKLWDISKGLLDKSMTEYNTATNPIIKEASKRNVAYFSVALNLLKSKNPQSIYNNPIYLNDDNNVTWFLESSCLNSDNIASKYSKALDAIVENISFYYTHSQGIDGYIDQSDNKRIKKPEKNINKIIDNVFKDFGFNSSEDIAVMQQIQKACEKDVIKFFQNNYSLDLFDTAKYQFETPSFVKNMVDQELINIENHKGWDFSPIFIYQEDYSQYVPRAHYTKSDILKQYFKAMMWYGRMTFLAQGNSELDNNISECTSSGIISQYDAKVQTTGSLLINWYLLNDFNLQKKLTAMIDIMDFLVGSSDDFGIKEYSPIVTQYITQPSDIVNKFDLIQKSILGIPSRTKIYSGLGKCGLNVSTNNQAELDAQAQNILNYTKGFRLFGQKFVIDSFWMSQLVSPYSGEYTGGNPKPFTWVRAPVTNREVRGFPRGLDVMSILGSQRAEKLIQDLGDANYTNYTKQVNKYKQEIKKFTTNDWYKTIYNAWLYSLTALLNNFVKGYPTFMLTQAYQDKSLTTALASWTQLRHDTLLYVKQSYTMAELGGLEQEPVIVGFVEPIPDLYIRLYQTSLIFQDRLTKLINTTTINTETDTTYSFLGNVKSNFQTLNDILDKLITISNKELRYEALTEDEYDFIDNFHNISCRLVTRLAISEQGGGIIDIGDIFDVPLVADVHTEGNTNQVLEEGVGKIRTGLFVYRAPQNNNLVLGIGPVFSYYEFKQPMENRLTDEEWKKMFIQENKQPNKPEWFSSFYTKD